MKGMKVFKFGGASVNSVERIQNLAAIVRSFNDQPLTIVISAMGKTTNALEKVVEAFYAGKKEEALQLFGVVKNQHLTTAKYLLVTHYNPCLARLNDFFTEIEWLLHDKPVRDFDYYYDQVVCVGELLSTCIISYFLNQEGIANEWLDVRDLLRTDDNFRDATIDWKVSTERIHSHLTPNNSQLTTPIYVTQGFIGATADNESTTLGREGSDYTAAVFANMLEAESVTIWKDVEGVMNADPKQFPDAQLIQELSFREVIEMAYYGAQVIHPKTIKPLQNKDIPLLVKCFLDPSLPGTTIHKKNAKALPPIIVVKQQQVLMQLNSQDFSFVGEQPMSHLYAWINQSRIKPNLVQTGAIGVQLCFDDRADRLEQLASKASNEFDVQLEKNLTLLTIRHYTREKFEALTNGKEILLQQQSKETVQVLYREPQ
ncbi:aspartate kinase [Hydrobacter penzbergensis]|uniref:Aspartokinase n=1 Tax=Hydrobacter penzbergensis TaxID=1235997 RepID=A0A8X8L9K1_9BACT|nr:aspartate kinase [Hydrobacter penzbergensis]SDW05652.1 aspartate kinase [Hydrobacter penzbergensis]